MEIDVVALSWCLPEIRQSLAKTCEAIDAHVATSNAAKVGGSLSAVDAMAGSDKHLKEARLHLHQAHGALQMAEIAAVPVVTQEAESLLERAANGELDLDAAAALAMSRALSAVVEYLEDLLAGSNLPAVALWNEYKALLELRAAERIDPADLFFPDLAIQPPAHVMAADATEVRADIGILAARARGEFERGLLGLLRGNDTPGAIDTMHAALGRLQGANVGRAARAFLWLSLAVFDALKYKALPVDLHVKRLVARVNLQARRTLENGDPVADRMLKDLLFQLARAGDGSRLASEVRRHYRLAGQVPKDFDRRRFGLTDPAAHAIARGAIADARRAWEALAQGSAGELPRWRDSIARLLGALASLPWPGVVSLANALQTVGERLQAPPQAEDPLALEVATAVLFAEEALETGLRTDRAMDDRAHQLGDRLMAVLQAGGEASATVDAEAPDWLVEISRKASDRMTTGAFVAELSAILRGAEQALDAYFRNPGASGALAALKPQFAQAIGVFRALGHDDPAAACSALDEDVQCIVDGVGGQSEGDHQRIAANLSALGFFVESLLQPHGQGAVFHFDTERRELRGRVGERRVMQHPVDEDAALAAAELDDAMGASDSGSTEERILAEREAIKPWLALLDAAPRSRDVHENLLACLVALERDAMLVDDAQLKRDAIDARALLEKIAAGSADEGLLARANAKLASLAGISMVARMASPVAGAAGSASASGSGSGPTAAGGAIAGDGAVGGVDMAASQPADDDDDGEGELREIFLLEAEEVLEAIADGIGACRETPADQGLLTTIRRSFHTLKGSSRMVGLDAFGAAGWAFEQVLNKWLADERPATPELLGLIEEGHALFGRWVARLQDDAGAIEDAQALIARCEALCEGKAIVATVVPASTAAPVVPVSTAAAPSTVAVQPVMPAIAALQPSAPVAPLVAQADADDADEVTVGDRTLSRALFDIFVVEARGSRTTMAQALGKWREALDAPAPPDLIRALHSLVGTSRHVGLSPVRALAAPSEHILLAQVASGLPMPAGDLERIEVAVSTIGRMLVAFGNRQEPQTEPEVEADLAALERQWADLAARPSTSIARAGSDDEAEASGVAEAIDAVEPIEVAEAIDAVEPFEVAEAIDAVEPIAVVEAIDATEAFDEVDTPQLTTALPPLANSATSLIEAEIEDPYEGLVDELDADLGGVFFEEADELLPAIDGELRRWHANPAGTDAPHALMRLAHTVKGSARMAGAMRLGQRVHEMETRVEAALASATIDAALVDDLLACHDQVMASYDALKNPAQVQAPVVEKPLAGAKRTRKSRTTGAAKSLAKQADVMGDEGATEPSLEGSTAAPESASAKAPALGAGAGASAGASAGAGAGVGAVTAMVPGAQQPVAAAQQLIRVRADLLDRMVSESGEVAVARARLDNEIGVIRQSMSELAENVNRLRSQLREIEIQADTQIQTRNAQSRDAREDFDPLEFDRYTRFQELTRMLAESVNDVATVHQNAVRALEAATQDLSRQNQVSRSLQQNLMRVRMVQFSTIADRLYRVVRQAAKDCDKRVTLEIGGGNAEIDRGVLERIAAPIEHMLRNSVAHGIETREARVAAGKSETGEVAVSVKQEGNEVILVFTDDGAGLDFKRIEQRGRERGLIAKDKIPTERELAQLIFAAGFSTATVVTAVAGRGVGMDVVRAEVSAIGGRIDIESKTGEGTRIVIHLPVSLAVSQIVLLGAGKSRFACQAALVERIMQIKPEELAAAYEAHRIEYAGEQLPLFYLGSLLELPNTRPLAQRLSPVIVLRSGPSRIALHVDSVVPNQEVVVKNVGPQLSRMTGIAGASVLGNGEIVLILNPVLLSAARPSAQAGHGDTAHFSATEIPTAATVMVVDDSVTVRKVTQRLLVREGYSVLLAKDGVDALRLLQDTVPDVMLVDIEMPRMDGFDLTKNVRGTPRLASTPIIMITSRTADKHRNHAMSLGVEVFLGKPYPEDELLRHVAGFVAAKRALATSDPLIDS